MAPAGHDSDPWKELDEQDFDDERLVVLEIEIIGTHVPVWREVIVPEAYPLDELHFTIQLLFDWSADGAYCFRGQGASYAFPEDADPKILALTRGKALDSTRSLLIDLLPTDGAEAYYHYAIEDVWDIAIRAVGHLTGSEYPFSMVPVCTGGEGNNPPEDVGGPLAYKDLCTHLLDERSRDHEAARLWMGLTEEEDYFDPDAFDIGLANFLLARDQVDAMEEELVPRDTAALRELCKELLAEDAAREADDILRVRRLAEALDTPAGHNLLESFLGEAFPEGIYTQDEPFTGPTDVGPGDFRVVSTATENAPEPEPAAAPAPRPSSRDRLTPEQRGRWQENCDVVLDAFRAWLERSGISQKTMEKHLENASYFLGVYLPCEGLSIQDGCYRLDDFFGFFLPADRPDLSATSMREHVTSVRKLYKCLAESGAIAAEAHAFAEESIRMYKEEWLSGF